MTERYELSGLSFEAARAVLEDFVQDKDFLTVKDGMAKIEQVLTIAPIPEADRIVFAEVGHYAENGNLETCWGVVIPKDQFKVGDICVLYGQDAYVPNHPELAFMESRNWRVRITTLRGAPSEALAMPVDVILPDYKGSLTPGTDVTVWAGALKYSKPLPMGISGDISGHFPTFIPVTDEPLFQVVPQMVEALAGKLCYVSTKCDGTSTTVFYHDNTIGACSRNYQFKDGQKIAVWNLVERYGLREKLARFKKEIALQWECVGVGINSNPLRLKEVDLRLFNVFDIAAHKYLDIEEMLDIAQNFEIPTVPIQLYNVPFTWQTAEELRTLAQGFYPNTNRQREGIVIRPMKETKIMNQRLSFKVINLLYKES